MAKIAWTKGFREGLHLLRWGVERLEYVNNPEVGQREKTRKRNLKVVLWYYLGERAE